MRRDDGQLRSRLAAGLTAAGAIAFVLTVAVVAASPAPRSDDAAAAPPPVAAEPHPTTTPTTSPSTSGSALEHQPGSRGDTPEDLPSPDDTAHDGAQPTAPTATADPSPTPPAPARAEEPPASPRVERSPAPREHGAQLWGRWYRADHLREGDVTVTVAGDHPLHVGFLRQERGDGLVWTTSCSTYGANVAVDPERLRVRDIGGTATGCDEVQQEQEAWLADLFAADPRWRSLGERLRLWTPDGRRIDLVEDPEGPGPPWS